VDLERKLFGVGGAELPDELENEGRKAWGVENDVRLGIERDVRVEHVGACSRAIRDPVASSGVFARKDRRIRGCI
jgi:hypothetical protein